MKENNTEKLLRLITNEDPAMRSMGLSMAEGTDLSENLFDKLLAISLWDPTEDLREKATIIVGKIDKEKVTKFPKYFEPFYDYKKEEDYGYLDELCDEEERIRIVNEIIKIKNPRVKILLLDALDKESRTSWTAVEILCDVLPKYSDGNLRRKLIKLIKKGRYGESHMVNCLSKVGCGEQITELIPLLDNKSTGQGFADEDTLITFLREQNVFDIIRNDYENSNTKEDRTLNIKRMGILGDIEACEYLEKIVRTDNDENIKTVAIGSLGKINALESIESLKALEQLENGILMEKLIQRAIAKIQTMRFNEKMHKERIEREKRIKEWEKTRKPKDQ